MKEPSRYDIPVGREYAISRGDLARKWGVSDRTARDIVAELRRTPTSDPFAIVSLSNSTGYWRTILTSELVSYVRERRSRGKNEFAAASDAERVLEMKGQISFL